MSYQYHTAVIGAGSGGLTVAVGLSKLGKKVALLERHQVGGDCTNVGCIPSKTLIHLSRDVEAGRMTAADALRQTRAKRDHLRTEETEWVENLPKVDFLPGHARFRSEHVLSVQPPGADPFEISAKNVVLATGAGPRECPVGGLGAERLLTNETLFEVLEPPRHLIVVGGGVIGVEMAFCFARLGSKVSLVDRGTRLLKVSEPRASEVLAERLSGLGVDLYLNTAPDRFDEKSRALTLTDGRRIEAADRVLVAVGRKPNLDLDLASAGLKSDPRGLETDDWGRTSVPNIYAIGDINHRSAYTHSANDQGRRLVKKLAFPWLPGRPQLPHYPSATFSDPEVAQVGPTLEQLRQTYGDSAIRSVELPLKGTDRAYCMDLRDGFVLLHALALEGMLLSATVVAPDAAEMISLLTLAINEKISLYRLSNLVFPYPVLSEAVKKASDQFVFSTLGALPRELGSYLKYRFT